MDNIFILLLPHSVLSEEFKKFPVHISQNLILTPQASPLSSELQTAAAAAKSLQSCSTQCDPVDGSPPGSSIHRILQTRVLEWGAIAFSNSRLSRYKIFFVLFGKNTVWLFYIHKFFSIAHYNSLNIIEQMISFKYCSHDGIISQHALLATRVCWLSYKICFYCEKYILKTLFVDI